MMQAAMHEKRPDTVGEVDAAVLIAFGGAIG